MAHTHKRYHNLHPKYPLFYSKYGHGHVHPKTVRACAFELSVMGEVVCALPEEIRQQYKQIPWNKIQGMRNKIIHEYYRIDEEIVWQTITNDLPPFISMLEKIISE